VDNHCSGMAGSLSEGSGALIAGDVYSSGVSRYYNLWKIRKAARYYFSDCSSNQGTFKQAKGLSVARGCKRSAPFPRTKKSANPPVPMKDENLDQNLKMIVT